MKIAGFTTTVIVITTRRKAGMLVRIRLGLNPAAACAIPAVTPACASAAQWITGLGVAAATAVVSTISGSTSQTEAERLSAGHEAAAGNRSMPGYGGNCTPDEHEEL